MISPLYGGHDTDGTVSIRTAVNRVVTATSHGRAIVVPSRGGRGLTPCR